jgi:hypothetical protein
MLFGLSYADWVQYYVMVGLVNVVINGQIRKINHDGDWGLTLVWFFGWPLSLIGHLITLFTAIFKGIKKRIKKLV